MQTKPLLDNKNPRCVAASSVNIYQIIWYWEVFQIRTHGPYGECIEEFCPPIVEQQFIVSPFISSQTKTFNRISNLAKK